MLVQISLSANLNVNQKLLIVKFSLIVANRNCVKTNSFYRKKKLFLVVHSQKIIDEKGCLEYL